MKNLGVYHDYTYNRKRKNYTFDRRFIIFAFDKWKTVPLKGDPLP